MMAADAPRQPGLPRAGQRAFLAVHGALQALTLALCIEPARDSDLGFHLATGRALLRFGEIPATNVLSFAEPDAVATNSQWLGALLFELCHRALGIAGPTLLKSALVALTVTLVVETARILGARASATLLAVGLGVLVASSRFVERPLLFTNLILALISYAVAIRIAGRGPGARRASSAAVVLALGLGPHLHSGAAFAFLMLGGQSLLCVVATLPLGSRWMRLPRSEALSHAGAFAAMLTLGAALASASLFAVHPHAARVLTTPFTMASDPFLRANLVEFRSPAAFPLEPMLPFWVMAAVTGLALLACVGRAPALVLLPMSFGLAIASRHVRFVDLLGFLAAPGLAWFITRLMTLRPGRAHGEGVALALALCVFVAAAARVLERGGVSFGFEPSVFPRALLADLRRLGVTGPAFVQDGWAGPYLGFRYPGEQVFFHPAFDCYSQRFFRDAYMRTRDGEPGWEQNLGRYDVRLVLMKYTSPGERRRQRNRPNLRQQLARDPDWALVSFDEYGLAFARRDVLSRRARAAIIEGVDPDTLRFVGSREGARAGLDALRSRGMQSSRQFALSAQSRRAAAPPP
jgi:hypothetical protein